MQTELDLELEKAQAALLARFAPETPRPPDPLVAGRDASARARHGLAAAVRPRRLSGAFEVVPILAALAENQRVLAVDRPGHGLADPSTTAASICSTTVGRSCGTSWMRSSSRPSTW